MKKKIVLLCLLNCILMTSCSNKHIINDVPFYSQEGVLPTGCELVSSKMVLEYFNKENVPIDSIVNNTNCKPIEYYNGFYYGYSPDYAFIGDPYDDHGYGCYPPVVVDMCNSIIKNYKAVDTTGQFIHELCSSFIDKDIPVLLWVTIGLEETECGTKWQLIDESGSITNDSFVWTRPEHCIVLVGYDDMYYYCQDPLMKTPIMQYDKSLVEKRHSDMGYRSVAFIKTS